MAKAYTTPDQQILDRRRALAMALQAQSMQPLQSPPVRGARISPLEGINKIAQSLMASYQNNQLDQQQQSLTDQEGRQRLAQALSLSGAVTPQPEGLPAPMAQPQEAQIPGENAVPAMSTPPSIQQLPVGPGQVQSRDAAVKALASALASTDPTMQEAGKTLLQSMLTGTREEKAQAAESARQLAGFQNQAGLQKNSQQFQGAQTKEVQLGENQRNDADNATRLQIAGMKQPVEKNPGVRDVETNGRIIREYFDQSDPATVTYSKDIGPVKAGPATAAQAKLDSSSQHYIDELSKDFKPVTASLQKIAQGQSLLAANNPSANALVAPTILEALVSGQGSGFRMTQPEIDAVNKGKGKIENFQNWLTEWSTDPSKYTSLSPERKQWLNGVLDIAKRKATAKIGVYEKATDSVLNGATPKDHQKAYRDAQSEWSAIDAGKPAQAQSSAVPAVGGTFNGQKVLKVEKVQ